MSFVKWKLFCQAVLFWEVPRRLDNVANFQNWMGNNFICNWVHKSKHAHLVRKNTPHSKVHGANMGPTWVLSAPDGPHVGPMNLDIRDTTFFTFNTHWAHQNGRHCQMHFSETKTWYFNSYITGFIFIRPTDDKWANTQCRRQSVTATTYDPTPRHIFAPTRKNVIKSEIQSDKHHTRGTVQITKTLGSMSIRYRSDTEV